MTKTWIDQVVDYVVRELGISSWPHARSVALGVIAGIVDRELVDRPPGLVQVFVHPSTDELESGFTALEDLRQDAALHLLAEPVLRTVESLKADEVVVTCAVRGTKDFLAPTVLRLIPALRLVEVA